MNNEKTLGSICAGIGGFDIGFEQAGWKTAWQIELDDVNRAVLADRFPEARRGKNLNDWRAYLRAQVICWAQCFAFGFPCQDLSRMGQGKRDKSTRGLAGSRSGLFFEIMEIVREIQPTWLVFENVPALLTINEGRDFQTILGKLRECGYLGYGRVLDSQYFGIPQKRRRLVVVAGLGRYPSSEFLADAGTVESLPCALDEEQFARPADRWAAYTLLAPDKYKQHNSRINLGSEILVTQEDGWGAMAERGREVELHGLRTGLDVTNTEEAYAAGNAFPPPMAKWVAEILNRSM